jgi:hypothetical protein
MEKLMLNSIIDKIYLEFFYELENWPTLASYKAI